MLIDNLGRIGYLALIGDSLEVDHPWEFRNCGRDYDGRRGKWRSLGYHRRNDNRAGCDSLG